MVKSASGLSLALVTTLGLLNFVIAVPTTNPSPLDSSLVVVHQRDDARALPATTTTTERFSFAKWVDDIIANPETALTPEQALQAHRDSLNGTLVATTANHDNLGVDKRWDAAVVCSPTPIPPALSEIAALLINNLAAATAYACSTSPIRSFGKGYIKYVDSVGNSVTVAKAEITGATCNKGSDPVSRSSCQSIAQTAGLIMDTCTYTGSDGQLYTQGMRMNVNAESNMIIWLRAPTSYSEPYCGWKG
ncbi:hypothetical protein SMACR_03680 [Sordaria macrospora]|uniref:WGS project CABT00000000 data, contig 2.9 n=2 Tax=Sordaria macrospora TaxID=5147 RepID=F7VVV7_SORMK|nr:uncharacterized protein SMAC_03680 [Sordaria macrospora k-hell]KAA8635104.1 hypothetical protein SMACR_03680 [Sordaria macrospora]KAH7625711.1 hypothetical protein B0T09DRAFT_392884 [Sordaria sp. MPI-SDFR-AT-0083]CCC09648.1 unnamed protein product [Sordaria macrospora k-hell]